MSNFKDKGQSGFNYLYRRYKYRAKLSALSFTINKKLFKELTSSNCFYCNAPPTQKSYEHADTVEGKHHSEYIYNGLDRINNKKGYTPSNVVPCCRLHNEWKRALKFKDFVKIIHKTSSFLKQKGLK